MLNTQTTSHPPLNLENRQGKLLKEKKLQLHTILTERKREREILTPELQSTVNMYLH
jgi:hypothetical protein